MNGHTHEIKGYGEIKLFAGTASPELANKIAEYLNAKLCKRDVVLFPNDNLFVKLHESVRGQDVYVIQTTSRPVQQNLMELLISLQTLRLDSAARITAVVPYLCYSRSDKKDQPRVPITSRLVTDMIEVAGSDRYMTLDPHAGQVQGFFSIPGDVLTASHIIEDYIKDNLLEKLTDPVIMTVDLGFAKKGRNYAEGLNMPVAFIEKRRVANDSNAEALNIIGDVNGRDVIIVDDEVDTGGSIAQAINLARENGARDVYLAFIHPVFSSNAAKRLSSLDLAEIITTDTVPIPEASQALFGDRLTICTVAPLLAEVILRAHEGRSVGELFDE
ncbi:MAG: ribose-phosphate pyrophosphokinase [Anaerolineae bacterium]|nr:ribose-phosphate pyrophosphokinase [Anaerolineae bacterium]MBT7189339.1 ribose-phosphate pyrophosphokinase [Anaerolineae bacterium]MBT7989968.1 ribose-phosphate pyrophosphokinase [Anaerolineae bacterium]